MNIHVLQLLRVVHGKYRDMVHVVLHVDEDQELYNMYVTMMNVMDQNQVANDVIRLHVLHVQIYLIIDRVNYLYHLYDEIQKYEIVIQLFETHDPTILIGEVLQKQLVNQMEHGS